MLKVVVLVGGAFGRGRALSNKITALKNGDPAELPRQLCVNEEEDRHQTRDLLAPSPWTSRLPEL